MVHVYRVNPTQKKRRLGFGVNTNLILINVIFFFIIYILLGGGIISDSFFNNDVVLSLENIKQLRLWTFFTSMFMHGGIFHLFANMVSLFFIGGLIQKILGEKRYLRFYLISGLVAGLFYILEELIFPSGLGAVGASGALFGVAGLMIVLTPNLPLYVMFIPIPIKAKYAIPGLLILLWGISFSAGVPIGNTAHLGGLICGLIYGFYLKDKYKNKAKMINKHFS